MAKPGPKPRPSGAGSVSFNVKPNAMRYLQRLVQRSAEFEHVDDAAQALFWIGLRRAMESKEFELTDMELWEPDEVATKDAEQPPRRRTMKATPRIGE